MSNSYKNPLAFPELYWSQKVNPTFGATVNAYDDGKWARQQKLRVTKNKLTGVTDLKQAIA